MLATNNLPTKVNPVRQGSANGNLKPNDKGQYPVIKLYRKIIEVKLDASKREYALDKYQSLNGKPLSRIIVPNYFAPDGTEFSYTNAPQSVTGNNLITDQSAIDGAYLKLVNQQNQLVDDGTPLLMFKTDDSIIWQKMEYVDTPYIDWTQSAIYYPNLTIPAAQAGKSIQLVIETFDWVYEDQLTFSTV